MRLFPVLSLFLFSLGLFASEEPIRKTPTMPLSEVKPGMTGEWETVIDDKGIQRFHFEVIGVVPNFIGPKRPAILAKATDASQILSGPVAGMSGSPCYIDGKLVGAYAYGFTWPKEQALIGITPIDSMFEALDKESQRSTGTLTPQTHSRLPGADFQTRLEAWGDFEKTEALLAGDTNAEGLEEKQATLSSLPTPLFASGISGEALEPFSAALKKLGMEPMAAPVGAADGLGEASVQAGTPLAGVLMDGDFKIAGVGTVTWREGDTFLAFGHPFFGSGDVEIPAAPAEILTVVQSVPRSFKLSNLGPVVGTIRQDRLTAISGEMGRMAPTTAIKYAVKATDGETREYSGHLFRDRRYSPFFAAIGLFQSLLGTMEYSQEQTLTMHARYDIEGYEPLEMTRVTTGPAAPVHLAIEQWLLLSLLMDNPFAEVEISDITFDIEQKSGWDQSTLEGVRQLSGQARAGEPWNIGLTLGRYLQDPTQESVSIPIPKGTESENLTVFVGDAASADRLQRGWSSRHVTSFDGLLDYLRGSRSDDNIYVMLLRPAQGLHIDGQDLPALPPSARLLLDNNRLATPVTDSRWQTLWEQSIAVPGVFSGSHYVKLKVR